MSGVVPRTMTGMLIAFLASVVPVNAQRLTGDHPDTVGTRVRLIDPGISLGRPVFLLPPTLSIIPDDFPGEDAAGIGASTPLLGNSLKSNIDLIAPFKLQLAKQKELQTLRSILGTVQVGAVAYLAYKQIKRWGKK